jgi:hypothetical protein
MLGVAGAFGSSGNGHRPVNAEGRRSEVASRTFSPSFERVAPRTRRAAVPFDPPFSHSSAWCNDRITDIDVLFAGVAVADCRLGQRTAGRAIACQRDHGPERCPR